MKNLQIFNYNETPVSFQIRDGTLMVNATEVAKLFDKRPNDFLNLPSTQKKIKTIINRHGLVINQLVITKRGSPKEGGGTWLNEDLATSFAQWLSFSFGLWLHDRIKELLPVNYIASKCNESSDYQIHHEDRM